MAYTNPDTLQEVANILDDFDEATLIEIFKSQIVQDDSYVKIPVNNFEPLYISYKKALELDSVEEDDIEAIKERFQNICVSIIQFIEAKFNLSVDMQWVESQFGNLPTLTMALYRFFVIDIFYIILAILSNYITKNLNELYDAFKGVPQRKDVATVTNMKTMSPVYALIVSSLFDVTDYAFSLLDNDVLFDYITPDYNPASVIHGCVEQGVITGDFTRTIADIYKENLELRSKVTIELAYRIREHGYLPENATVITSDQLAEQRSTEQEAASESYIDIDSDVDTH